MGEFREKVEAFILSDDDDVTAFMNSFPRHLQPEVMREMKSLAEEQAIKHGDYEGLKQIDGVGKNIDEFENAVIDELAQRQENEMKVQQLRGELEEKMCEITDHLIAKILEQGADWQNYIELTKKIIETLKEFGVYDEEYWKPILHLL